MDLGSIDQSTWDLSVKNPDGGEEIVHKTPKAILKEIEHNDKECGKVLEKISGLLG